MKYRFFNLDKVEYVDPHVISEKDSTITWATLIVLIMSPKYGIGIHTDDKYFGRWAGDRIIISGENDAPNKFQLPASFLGKYGQDLINPEKNLYALSEEGVFLDISKDMSRVTF